MFRGRTTNKTSLRVQFRYLPSISLPRPCSRGCVTSVPFPYIPAAHSPRRHSTHRALERGRTHYAEGMLRRRRRIRPLSPCYACQYGVPKMAFTAVLCATWSSTTLAWAFSSGYQLASSTQLASRSSLAYKTVLDWFALLHIWI